MITNNRTVTIKMTRGQALRLGRLIIDHAAQLQKTGLETEKRDAYSWLAIYGKIIESVERLDRSETDD